MPQTTETPIETLDAATTRGVLPPDGLVLLGTFIKPEGASSALVRTAAGDTRSVATGDKLGGYTVLAIDTGALRIARSGGHSRKLTLPGDD